MKFFYKIYNNLNKGVFMKLHGMFFLFALILFCSSIIFAQQGAGPEIINLKEKYAPAGNMKAVNFPHWLHQNFAGCDGCHSMTDMSIKNLNDNSTITPKRNPMGAFHNDFCWPCHRKMGSSIECIKCHTGTGTKK
jgi:hypothetical protein